MRNILDCNIFIIIALNCYISYGIKSDSDGTNFVVTFSALISQTWSSLSTASLIIIPIAQTSTCQIKWFDSNKNDKSVNYVAKFGKVNIFQQFKINDVVTFANVTNDSACGNRIERASFQVFKKFKILVVCDNEVKLIASLQDPINAVGDLFLVPNSAFTGNYYSLFFVPSVYNNVNLFSLISTTEQNNIKVIFMNKGKTSCYSNINVTNSDDIILLTHQSQSDTGSVIITSDHPIIILLTAPQATTFRSNNECIDQICYPDYVTYMPQSQRAVHCEINAPTKLDRKMILSQFTDTIYISPPSGLCTNPISLDVYRKTTYIKQNSLVINDTGTFSLKMNGSTELGLVSYYGGMPSSRFGSYRTSASSNASFGHILHYIPSISEYITLDTQFFTFNHKCILELYTHYSIDLSDITIDGDPLINMSFQQYQLSIFDNDFAQLIIFIPSYGIHTIYAERSYTGYVICQGALSAYNTFAYTIGYNKRS